MRRWLLICTASLAGSCGSDKDTGGQAAPPAAGAAADAGTRAEAAPRDAAGGQAAASPIDEAQVRALVDRWVDVQNRGDFAAYQALYDERFTGVLRVGRQVRKMDRSAWMKSRGRMFNDGFTVSVAQLSIVLEPKMALVRLVQTFRAAKVGFADVGPKQLVILRGPGGLVIAHEAMLESRVAPGASDPGTVFAVDLPPPLVRAVRDQHPDADLELRWGIALPPGAARGATHALYFEGGESVFVLAGVSAGGGRVVDTATADEVPSGLSLARLRDEDVDGDGHKDVLLTALAQGDHERWEYLVVFASQQPGVEVIEFSNGGGEEGWGGGETSRHLCFERAGDRVHLINVGENWRSKPLHEHPADGIDHQSEPFVRIYDWEGGELTLADREFHGVRAAHGDQARIAALWRKEVGDPKAEDGGIAGYRGGGLEHIATGCHSALVVADGDDWKLIVDLSPTEAEARKKAAARGIASPKLEEVATRGNEHRE